MRFAPTEEAFTAALEALGITAEELLAREALTDIPKFYVTPSAMAMCTDLKAGERKVGSMRGSALTVTFADGKITVKDATVSAADVDTSNGEIHIIDEVLLPPSNLADVVDAAVAAGKRDIPAAAFDKSRIGRGTDWYGPFTVFASTDEALTTASEAPGVTAEELLAREDLADTAKYHVIPVA